MGESRGGLTPPRRTGEDRASVFLRSFLNRPSAGKGRAMEISSALVSVRGDANDDEAVELAGELLNSARNTMYILYVIEMERSLPLDAEVGASTAKGEQVLKHMENVAKRYKCKTEAHLLQARQAGGAVIQEAVDRNVDAIVISMPYSGRYDAFSLGDSVPYVLKNAPCRVILCRDQKTDPAANERKR
jgi:nucleotide-binding universal stress UspA family protein